MSLQHQLPPKCSLFVATPQIIHLRSAASEKTLFKCETADGIVNAKASRDNSGLIAIADSHVVILYDTTRGNDRKYRLNNVHGEPRIMLFSPDSRILYFTTTLSTSVQAYSIPTAELMPSSPTHPSPPNTIAVSRNGDILLSASPMPPTVCLQDRRWGGSAPMNFQPADVHSPVTCAAFQAPEGEGKPSYANFVIGFQDGALVMYRLLILDSTNHRKAVRTSFMGGYKLQPIRIGAIRKLHKAAMGGITAVEFLPGYKSRIVSIGHDGRCRLVDFEHNGRVLRTWHVSGPATSLSILSNGPRISRGRKDNEVLFGGDASGDTGKVYTGSETLIAIGTQVGRVLVFNVLGLLVHEIFMDAPVLDVQWVGDMSARSVLPNRTSSLALEPGPTVDDCRMSDDQTSSDKEEGTVRKTCLSNRDRERNALEIGRMRTLFADEHGSREQSRRPSDLEHPRKKSLLRPRIATETFRSPSSPTVGSPANYQGSTVCLLPTLSPQAHRKQPPTHRNQQDDIIELHSSPHHNSDFSNAEALPPPPTEQDARKASRHHKSPQTLSATSGKVQEPSLQDRVKGQMQQYGTVDGANAALYEDIRIQSFCRSSPQSMGASIAQIRQDTTVRGHPSQQSKLRTAERSGTLDSPSSVYSRLVSGFFVKQFADGQYRQENEEDDEGDQKHFPQTTLHLLQRKRRMNLTDKSASPISQGSPSSYSKSCVARTSTEALHGEIAVSPYEVALAGCQREEVYFNNEPHMLEHAAEQCFDVCARCRSVNGLDTLRHDNEMLRREMVALRTEVRELRDVVLTSRSMAR